MVFKWILLFEYFGYSDIWVSNYYKDDKNYLNMCESDLIDLCNVNECKYFVLMILDVRCGW